MLITNGIQTRNIAERQLPEYERKGYRVVVVEAATQPAVEKKPTAKKSTKKASA